MLYKGHGRQTKHGYDIPNWKYNKNIGKYHLSFLLTENESEKISSKRDE